MRWWWTRTTSLASWWRQNFHPFGRIRHPSRRLFSQDLAGRESFPIRFTSSPVLIQPLEREARPHETCRETGAHIGDRDSNLLLVEAAHPRCSTLRNHGSILNVAKKGLKGDRATINSLRRARSGRFEGENTTRRSDSSTCRVDLFPNFKHATEAQKLLPSSVRIRVSRELKPGRCGK